MFSKKIFWMQWSAKHSLATKNVTQFEKSRPTLRNLWQTFILSKTDFGSIHKEKQHIFFFTKIWLLLELEFIKNSFADFVCIMGGRLNLHPFDPQTPSRWITSYYSFYCQQTTLAPFEQKYLEANPCNRNGKGQNNRTS